MRQAASSTLCPPGLARTPWIALALSALALGGCSGGSAPTLEAVPTQTVSVGVELRVELIGADADGGTLSWSLSSETIADLTSRAFPATITPFGEQSAYLRWTPLATDVGTQRLEVRASDGEQSASLSFDVIVTAQTAAPVFRQPLGAGTTLDLSRTGCVAVRVLVEDADSPDVSLELEDPIEEGYLLEQDDPFGGAFTFCPTPKQIEQADRYIVNFLADDREGHIDRKKYTIVLRRELSAACPGAAPTITHAPAGSIESIFDLEIRATIGDETGLSGSPSLYASLVAPADPSLPDFSSFVQIPMLRESGDSRSGTYVGIVPNPVVTDAPGTSRTIYYFIEAMDDDDPVGACDHRSTAPVADVYSLEILRPAAGAELGECEACSDDAQCQSRRCVAIGGGAAYCLSSCTEPGAACALGASCSSVAWSSMSGTLGLVCMPAGGSCAGTSCTDDAFEPNDSADDPGVTDLVAGLYPGLQLCADGAGGVDEDFYGLLIGETTLLTASLAFVHDAGDIELQLQDATGASLRSSLGVTDGEQVSACLDPGLYFLRVFSLAGDIDNSYDLELDLPTGCCIDDALEEDDSASAALPLIDGDVIDGRTICPGDDDWYQIDLDAGMTLSVDLLFDQPTSAQDLDLHLYEPDGITDLTPCPPCDSANGQSSTSDETLVHTATTSGTYYIVVRGYAGASADYLLGVGLR